MVPPGIGQELKMSERDLEDGQARWTKGDFHKIHFR